MHADFRMKFYATVKQKNSTFYHYILFEIGVKMTK